MINKIAVVLATGLLAVTTAFAADEPKANPIYTDTKGTAPVDWKEFLLDVAPGSVSAAGLLGIDGESVTPVENVRDLIVSLKGLSSDESKETVALAFSPARSFGGLSHHTYRKNPGWLASLYGGLTFGYAQGDADIGGAKFERRAFSVETSFLFWPERDDPVIVYSIAKQRAVADAISRKKLGGAAAAAATTQASPCDIYAHPQVVAALNGSAAAAGADAAAATDQSRTTAAKLAGDPKLTLKAAQAEASGDAPPPPPGQAPLEDQEDPDPTGAATFQWLEANDPLVKAMDAANKECSEFVDKSIRWNRSQAFLSYAAGWIKAATGPSDEQTLGRMMLVGATYGFDGLPAFLSENFALSLTYRRTLDEPVLTTLGTAAVVEKDTSLVVGRITGGTKKVRALVEVSDAGDDQVTASQRAFKQAVGLDFRVYDDLWVNLRYGRQRTIDGTENENGSLFTVSYSPTALLK